MSWKDLARKGWFRGLIFGALVGLAVGLLSMVAGLGAAPAAVASAGGGGDSSGGVQTMGPGDEPGGGPVLPAREAALLRVAQVWRTRGQPARIAPLVDEVPVGLGRDALLDELIQAKIIARQTRAEGAPSDPAAWIDEMRADAERMGPSTIKVERLIQLSQYQRELDRGPEVGAPVLAGDPAASPPKDNPRADALLERAAEVARSIPRPGAWSAPRLLRLVVLAAACGLLGLVAGALLRPAAHAD